MTGNDRVHMMPRALLVGGSFSVKRDATAVVTGATALHPADFCSKTQKTHKSNKNFYFTTHN